MKINEKQLIMLYEIAKASCYLQGDFGGFPSKDRIKLVNDILNQQDNRIVEVSKNSPLGCSAT
jgi:hypothetical protein